MSRQEISRAGRFSVETYLDFGLINEALPILELLLQDNNKVEQLGDELIKKFRALDKELSDMIANPPTDTKKKKERISKLREQFREFLKGLEEFNNALRKFVAENGDITKELELKYKAFIAANQALTNKLMLVVLEALEEVLK